MHTVPLSLSLTTIVDALNDSRSVSLTATADALNDHRAYPTPESLADRPPRHKQKRAQRHAVTGLYDQVCKPSSNPSTTVWSQSVDSRMDLVFDSPPGHPP